MTIRNNRHLHIVNVVGENGLDYTKSEICYCSIGIDHRRITPMDEEFYSESEKILYFTRRSMFYPWEPFYSGKKDNISVYHVWLKEDEKDSLIAHWEKTGMFGSIVEKIRSAENTKGIQ